MQDVGKRVVAALGEPAARELLDVLESSDPTPTVATLATCSARTAIAPDWRRSLVRRRSRGPAPSRG
jgi:hypothetical protein